MGNNGSINVNVHVPLFMSTGNGGSADNSPSSPVSTDRLFRAIFVEGHTLLPQIVPKAITSANIDSDGSVMYITFAEGMKLKLDEIDMEKLTCRCTMSHSDADDSVGIVVTHCKFEPAARGGSELKMSTDFVPKGDVDQVEDELDSRIEKVRETFKIVGRYLAKNPEVCA
ncbi:hypothetical protein C5167_007918 [Papaver somniferum]|uniref:major allergen Pru ar 1-like n=1 Tax=Papaver somniferum TaxID=3469 RepID=UPI000E6F95BD|nr:major allergen Pru ar 1-like [Papaver somniferum]RZC92897.1 hypothetical protein C5167_007918 [Papaver somniferum]